jgi:hypothetical protein
VPMVGAVGWLHATANRVIPGKTGKAAENSQPN